MAYTHSIKKLLNIKDPNIHLAEIPVIKEKKKGQEYLVVHGKLTYRPSCCKVCGIKNSSYQDLIKHGTKRSTLTLTHVNFQPVLLRLKKQRFLCKHCDSTFIAETSLVDRHCFISNVIKATIAMELKETQSMTLIAQHLSVSPPTVIRVMRQVAETLEPNKQELPQHLSIDEFKSVKDVSGAMSFLFINALTHQLTNVVENRQLPYLLDYFMRYPVEVRNKVQTVTMDMYSPYTQLVRDCFPHAKIIIDRFHIVQHMNRALNSERIKVMKEMRYTRPRDYRKLKNQWKLVLKNEDDLDFSRYFTHRLYEGAVTEKMMADYLVQLDPKLERVYALFNQLKWALEHHDFKRFKRYLKESKKYILPRKARTVIKTFEKYLEPIKNAFIYTLSNGPIEGMNNKIKNIKRTGYGYRNFNNLRARILVSYRLTASHYQPRTLYFEDKKAG
ncbi:ISL3 family transposase [Carnobacterium mobile]|uniref:ISL3 family transposase n=1 Tax=Carnobacterium mobile TaxID=2750 RepID=UPI00186814D0|nr:ISL3 family transposase [Carnobacterium mobile]